MRRIVIAIALILIGQTVFAQAESGAKLRAWKHGPLSWNDFKEYPSIEDPVNGSWLHYSFELVPEDTLINGFRTNRLVLTATMDKDSSWVLSDHKTQQELRFNQVIFNLAHIQCCLFQSTLDRGTGLKSEGEFLTQVGRFCMMDEDRFVEESDAGRNEEVVNRWLDSTIRLIATLPQDSIPQYEYSKKGIGYAAHLGTCYSALVYGNQTVVFGNPLSFELGFEADFGPHAFMWDTRIGGTVSKVPCTLDGSNFSRGELFTWMYMGFDYGYYLYRKDKMALIPVAGIGFTCVSKTITEDYSVSDACFSATAGIAFDWNTRRTVSYPDFYEYAERAQEEIGFRVKAFVSNTNLCGSRALSINTALCVNFGSKPVKLK